METDRRTASPDFAAGEAHFFRKLRAAFSDLQTQCENEKVFNQRSFERDQQAIRQHIRELEAKCYDLAKKRREAEDAHRKVALELQQKQDEETEGRVAYHQLEEDRRRKYSTLLAGSSATDLRLVVAPRHIRNVDQSPVIEIGQMSDAGPHLLLSLDGYEGIQNVPIPSHEQDLLSGISDRGTADKPEHRSGVTLSPAENSAEEGPSETLITTDIRRGKRKRVPTAKAQPGLGLWEQLHGNMEVFNKRRALTPRQTESSPDHQKDRPEDRTSQRQGQDQGHSVIEAARLINNEEMRAQTVVDSSTEPVPSQPSALHTNADETQPEHGESPQNNGLESIDLSAIDGSIADLGLSSPRVPADSGRTRHLHLLTDPVNSGNPVLTDLASRALEAQVLATATVSQKSGSHSGQAWDSSDLEPERGHTDPGSRSQTPGNGDSPIAEICRASSRDSPHAESIDSSHSASLRSRGPSALKPLRAGQPQRDSRKALPNFKGEIFKRRTKYCLPSVPARDRTRKWEESPTRWISANRSAGGQDRIRSSSVRETQGPLLQPVCVNCRKKKRKCDRQRPRCGNCVKQDDECVPVGTI